MPTSIKCKIILNSVFSAADAVDCLLCQIEKRGKLCDRHKVEDVGIALQCPLIALTRWFVEHHHLFLKKVGIARQSEADVFKHLTLPAFVEKIQIGQRHIAHIRRLHKFDDDMMVSGTDNRFRTDKEMRCKREGEIVLASALDIISPRRASDEENHIFQMY